MSNLTSPSASPPLMHLSAPTIIIPTPETNSIQHSSDELFNSFNDIKKIFGFKIESAVKLFGGCAISFISYLLRIKPTIISAITQYKLNIKISECEESTDNNLQSAAFENLLNQHLDVMKICSDFVKFNFDPKIIRISFIECLSEVQTQATIFTSVLHHQLKIFLVNCRSTIVSYKNS